MISNHIKTFLQRLDESKNLINKYRPLSPSVVTRIREQLVLDWTYNSNAIEGNTMTLRETKMVLNEGLTIGGKTLNEHLEIINHKDAISFVEEIAQINSIITERELKDIHALVLRNIDPNYAGRYRDIQVRISGSSHTPPDPLHVPEQMRDFTTKYLVYPQGHPIEQAALAHFHLVSIHPFVDGNGRTARLLMNLILIKNGFPPAVILKVDRKKYYAALEKGNAGNTNDFIFLVGRALERTMGLYMESIPELYSDVLTMAQAEKLFPHSKNYLSVMARRGAIPAFKIKRDWVVLKRDLQEYVKRQTTKKKT